MRRWTMRFLRPRRAWPARMKRKRLARALRGLMAAAGGVVGVAGVGDAGLRVRRRLGLLSGRRLKASRRSLRWRLRRWRSARRERLRDGLLRCVSRESLGSRVRRLVRVRVDASVAGASAVDGIGTVVDASGVGAISGWIRCGRGLRREVLGRLRATMR